MKFELKSLLMGALASTLLLASCNKTEEMPRLEPNNGTNETGSTPADMIGEETTGSHVLVSFSTDASALRAGFVLQEESGNPKWRHNGYGTKMVMVNLYAQPKNTSLKSFLCASRLLPMEVGFTDTDGQVHQDRGHIEGLLDVVQGSPRVESLQLQDTTRTNVQRLKAEYDFFLGVISGEFKKFKEIQSWYKTKNGHPLAGLPGGINPESLVCLTDMGQGLFDDPAAQYLGEVTLTIKPWDLEDGPIPFSPEFQGKSGEFGPYEVKNQPVMRKYMQFSLNAPGSATEGKPILLNHLGNLMNFVFANDTDKEIIYPAGSTLTCEVQTNVYQVRQGAWVDQPEFRSGGAFFTSLLTDVTVSSTAPLSTYIYPMVLKHDIVVPAHGQVKSHLYTWVRVPRYNRKGIWMATLKASRVGYKATGDPDYTYVDVEEVVGGAPKMTSADLRKIYDKFEEKDESIDGVENNRAKGGYFQYKLTHTKVH